MYMIFMHVEENSGDDAKTGDGDGTTTGDADVAKTGDGACVKTGDGDGDGRLNQTECTALALELGFEAQVNDRLGADDTIEIIDAFRAFTGATREEAENIFIVLDTVSDVVENVGVVSLHPTPAKLEEQKQRMTVRRIKRMRKSILATIPLEVPELPAHFIPRCKTLSFPLILPSRAVAAKKDSISTVYLRHD